MLSQISLLRRSDALPHNIRSLGSRYPKLPDIIRKILISEDVASKDVASRVSAAPARIPNKRLRIQSTLAENIRSPHHCILRIRPCVSLKTQRVFEIESNHRSLRKLQHEISQRADSHLRCNTGAFTI